MKYRGNRARNILGGDNTRCSIAGAAVVMKSFGPVLCLEASIARLCFLFREIGYAGQALEMIVRGNKFDIVFSGAGVDDGIGKGELV